MGSLSVSEQQIARNAVNLIDVLRRKYAYQQLENYNILGPRFTNTN